MRRRLALVWLALVLVAAGYLGWRAQTGFGLQSSILALLPQERRDPLAERAHARVAEAFSHRIVLLLGHEDPARARAAAQALAATLRGTGLISRVTTGLDPAQQQALAAQVFPHRAGLLAEADRAALLAEQGHSLAQRALAMLFAPGGVADARLLAQDPFLLFPAWLAALPLPESRLTLQDGQLMVRDGSTQWAFLGAELAGDPFALAFQAQLTGFLDTALPSDVQVLRTGAVFYATEAAAQAMAETSSIGSLSMAATVLLLLAVFRRPGPTVLGVLAIGIGIGMALACCLWWFTALHSVALLFGASLIGVAVDYSFEYFSERFDPTARTPGERMQRVMPGLSLGLATTLIGYLTLLLAPFPGLRQIAAFSVVGLVASCLTVVLWFPLLDRGGLLPHGAGMLRAADAHARLWQSPRWRRARLGLLAVLGLLALAGLPRLHAQDDVRAMQALSGTLRAQEDRIQALTSQGGAAQFLLVQGESTEAVLRREEAVLPVLDAARRDGRLGDYLAVARLVPSAQRQAENRALVARALAPHWPAMQEATGFTAPLATTAETPLTPAMLPAEGPLALVHALTLDTTTHLVLLQHARDLPALRAATEAIPGVRLVSLAEDWTALFGHYRRQAVWLLVLSVFLMLPLLAWRYRARSWRVLAPPVAAVALTPPLAALLGASFTFFDAMALVLVLSIGVDYAVFCAETTPARRPVTMLAVALAAISTLLSFGLLALSQVFAVQAFGTTMLIGIGLAVLLAPAAARPVSSAAARPLSGSATRPG